MLQAWAGLGGVSLRSALLVTTVLFAATTGVSHAQTTPRAPDQVAQAAPAATTYSFAIPPGPLAGALNAFGRTTGLSVVFTQAEAAGAQSPGASGTLTADAALARLLAGTGWSHRFADARTVTLTRAVTRDGAVALPEVQVQAALIPPTATIGAPPPTFAGGQVATGGGIGLLGNRSIFDTPFSQTNYTEQLIRDQQSRTLPDLLANDPSVRVTLPRHGMQDNFFIRGLRLDPGDVRFEGLPGVTDTRRPALEGIERVEVLRGPSTLLSGISANGNVAGIINFIPKRAGDTPLLRLTGRYGSDATFGGAIDAGRRFGPDGVLGVRVNAAIDDGDTPIERQRRRARVATLGMDARLESFRASLDLTYQDQAMRRPNWVLFANPGFAIPAAPQARTSWQQPWETYSSSFAAAVARAEYDLLPGTTLFGAFGISRFEDKFLISSSRLLNRRGDITQQPQLLGFDFNSTSAEVGSRSRFQTGSVRHNVVLAASGYWRTVFTLPGGNVGGPILSNLYAPVFVPARPTGTLDSRTRRSSEARLTSFTFANTMSVLDERVQLLLGARLQRVDTENLSIVTGLTTARYNRSALTPTVGLTIKPWRNLMLYASYIEGLAAGPTAPLTVRNAGQVFAPTVTRQSEIGAKYDFGTFGVSLALFEITQPSGFINPRTNVFSVDGEQRNRGAEFSVFGTVAEGVRALGGVSIIDGELTSTAGGRNDGRTAPGTPRLQMSVGGEYDLPFVPGLTARALVVHTSSQYYDAANTQSIPAWTRLDLGARYRFNVQNTAYTARFTIENVTGANYWASTGRTFLTLGAPRTYLFSLSADF